MSLSASHIVVEGFSLHSFLQYSLSPLFFSHSDEDVLWIVILLLILTKLYLWKDGHTFTSGLQGWSWFTQLHCFRTWSDAIVQTSVTLPWLPSGNFYQWNVHVQSSSNCHELKHVHNWDLLGLRCSPWVLSYFCWSNFGVNLLGFHLLGELAPVLNASHLWIIFVIVGLWTPNCLEIVL